MNAQHWHKDKKDFQSPSHSYVMVDTRDQMAKKLQGTGQLAMVAIRANNEA